MGSLGGSCPLSADRTAVGGPWPHDSGRQPIRRRADSGAVHLCNQCYALLGGGSGFTAATAVAAGFHVSRSRVGRREGSRRSFPARSAARSPTKVRILRRLAATRSSATKTLWAATPRIRRRWGWSSASWLPSFTYPLNPSMQFRSVWYTEFHWSLR